MEYLYPPSEVDEPYSISAINRAVSDMIADGSSVVWLTGEVTSLKKHSSGHTYLRLKDSQSQIPAVLWKTNKARSPEELEDGMMITAVAILRVYERGGYYQLDIQKFVPDGAGALFQKLEDLKRKLHEEGLFSLDRKRPLPPIIKRVGVITAKTGAALHDILNVMARNAPQIDIVLASAIVQGPNAGPSLVQALKDLNESESVDVIIFGRGGGSAEDLSCFNDEAVVRAVVASEIPVVAAIGHEVDTTLTDFAADLRAPTPSAAAEMVVKEHLDRTSRMQELVQQFRILSKLRIKTPFELLQSSKRTTVFRRVSQHIRDARVQLDNHTDRVGVLFTRNLQEKKRALAEKVTLLDAKSPLALLAKGFSVATKDATVISSIEQVTTGDPITLRVSDGEIDAEVITTRTSKNYFDTDTKEQ